MADDLVAFPTPDSNTENKPPARKPRGKAVPKAKDAPATKVVAKGKATARRASGGNVPAVQKQNAGVTKKAGAKAGRKALAERPQAGNVSDTEEVDDFGEEDEITAVIETAKPVKKSRPVRTKKAQEEAPAEIPPPAKKTRKAVEKMPAAKPAPKAKTTAKSKAAKRAPEPVPEEIVISETQPDAEPMDIEESVEIDEIPESMPPPPQPRSSARRTHQQPRTAGQTSAPRRAGSASDSERDPSLRRRVGEVTKKLEAMTVKYEALKDIATSSKESNFDQLKRKTDQASKDQDAYIKALKQQISELEAHSTLLSSVKKELAKVEEENAALTSENNKLTASLTTAQNETKSLANKLAAARSAVPEQKNVPGSAIKPRAPGVILPGTVEATKDAQIKMAKVDLYSDLTNLVIVGIKKNDEGEDVYDCLQTGRNGTLQFQLTVTDSGESYEETEIVYNPMFNEQRDKELLDLLPDYLTEEICFPRNQAPKFYMKVVDSMSKKIILEEE
ncbi:hypothetical protein K504DRAFT_471565 [Pleomassaria siparia CBS 279.74]|uniref:Monopolin complex subunit Csm1/Pcs1 C-terminal domain-containing protein n=1 Tax=Pleomassaria siparia CBS 279.74 TaxID=1314801 RepID=A0A6G1JZC4_9PLEO|nr:hypothetical protein K504DRAFT_471565 [Pleomassaria siparia CBS 279.74]